MIEVITLSRNTLIEYEFLLDRQVSLLFHRLNSDDKKSEEPPSDDQYEQNIKLKILDASLPFVLDLGWSQEALVKGAESLGYPGVTHGIFLRGGADLVHHFYQGCNKKLALNLKEVFEKYPFLYLLFLISAKLLNV